MVVVVSGLMLFTAKKIAAAARTNQIMPSAQWMLQKKRTAARQWNRKYVELTMENKKKPSSNHCELFERGQILGLFAKSEKHIINV